MRVLKNALALIVTVVVGIVAGYWLVTVDAIDAELGKRRSRGHGVHRVR